MNKIIIIFICLVISGCYTTMTSVFSSYGLNPHEKISRQPSRLFEASPHLALGDNLLVRFIYVPGRAISPNPKTCEQSMQNDIDMLIYSKKKYFLDLSKTSIRVKNRHFHLSYFRKYNSDRFSQVNSGMLTPTGLVTSGFDEFKNSINTNYHESYERYIKGKGVNSGIALQFDGDFSCGENNYEMDLYFINDETKNSEKYTIHFFPWQSSLTPH
ncbi:MAG TPA: hypothetical protein DCM65_07900 [Acinetobacter junii]|nr:hypothetical protein [Acinetobacter junii]